MELEKRFYIGNHYEHRKVEGEIDLTINGKDLNLTLKDLSFITYRVMCWRKANAIHAWFVKHVQNGNDNCGEYCVSGDKLQNLVDLCKEALKALENATPIETSPVSVLKESGRVGKEVIPVYDVGLVEDILPPQEGFFFGGTNVDQWYINTLKETVVILEAELKNDLDGDYYYSSTW